MRYRKHQIPSKGGIWLSAFLFAVAAVIMHRGADAATGYLYQHGTTEHTLIATLFTIVGILSISAVYRLAMRKRMVILAEHLENEKMKLSKACPGFRSETCTGRKVIEHTEAVLQSVPRLTELLKAHLNEVTSLTEDSALSIIARLTDVLKASSGFNSSLGESKQRADNVHMNATQQIATSRNMATEMNSYKLRREVQMQGDTAAIHEVLTLIRELKPLTDLIRGIASKTKILSLNALIEAAGAGATGRSFAVVAAEMKGLSCQCETASARVDEGIRQVAERVTSNLAGLTDAVRIATEMNWLSTLSAGTGKITLEFEIALTELNKLSSDSLSAVRSISHSITDVLEQAQFQDISRQQIEQVQEGLTMYAERMVSISTLLTGAETIDTALPPLDDTFRIIKSNYTMNSQRAVHESVLSTNPVEKADNRPSIELF